MERFTTLEAVACPLGIESVDTDQLIPARFMSRSRAQGYGGYLLHDLRFEEDGSAKASCLLNAPRYSGTRILVTRRNFGTGSSREAAVYALWDYGIKAIIAPSFGDIFASNAVKNGLLPAVISAADCEALLSGLNASAMPVLSVDLTKQKIRLGEKSVPFSVDAVRRLQLLNGWDDIDLTQRHTDDIERFRQEYSRKAPWVFDTTRQT
jgi:3-isopropylmalate/(R)-2-methylmalate dehydratase small subunit